MDEASCESDGINLAEYAPKSSSLLELSPEYFKGDLSAFSWGHGISIDTDNDFMKDKKDLKRFPEAECLLLTYALEAITLLRRLD